MTSITLIFIAYLLGSIPFGYLIARSKNIDIRNVGSGNIGGTNVQRALGIRYGIVVYLLDIVKGALPTLMVSLVLENQIITSIVALAAVLGHIFPVFLHFKGGKGIATFAGTLIVLLGIPVFLLTLFVWFIVLYLTKIMSLTNLILTVSIPFIFLFITNSVPYCLYSILTGVLIFWSHRANITRLKNGKEKQITLPSN